MSQTKDEIIISLQNDVSKLKEEIQTIEKPNWITNCNYQAEVGLSTQNIHVISDVNKLIQIMGKLIENERIHNEAVKELNLPKKYTFKHQDFSVNDWKNDIKLRIGQISLKEKKTILLNLEERLSKLESPELREQRELENITNELNKLKNE